ncbi:hypothetical protein JVT61DRAFT_5796 [Boletus reticuloceps]|uniref:SprT-like domain-containing protein n=1 Tax=Boletus reticuloceps TaxID=495285 RepID=A0A8I2Z2V6_9AGAM|nr:hypothetical protein JVT61DRAFT_5796 [Boletus reticuloceps]
MASTVMVSSNETKSSLSSSAEDSSSLRIIEISSDSEDDVFRKPQRSKFGSTSQGENKHHESGSAWGNGVIELTDSDSSDSSDLPDALSPLVKGPRKKESTSTRRQPPSENFIPLYVDTSDDEESDKDCILVLNDPPASRRPIRSIPPAKGQDAAKGNTMFESPKKNAVLNSSQRGRRSVLKAKEQARLQKYATDLFAQLNKDVFGDCLPKDTTLEWSKRLLTTAGRARWHRSCEGMHTTRIELASKILDCDGELPALL